MSEWNGFGDLDLSDVEVTERKGRLSPGEYTVVSSDATIETLEGNAKIVRVVFTDVGKTGDIRNDFRMHGFSDAAIRIGKEKLKQFLIASGHPSPDKPGDVKTLNGLSCRVFIGMGKKYTAADGSEKQYSEIKSFMPVGPAAKTDNDLNDEIPF